MKKLWIALICWLPVSVFAWNAYGHVLVAEIAYDQLSVPVRQKVDVLAEQFFHQLSTAHQMALTEQFPYASTFAQLSVLPDSWWNISLGQLSQYFKAPLPQVLSSYKNSSLMLWHYVDNPYPSQNQCHNNKAENVLWAIPTVEAAISQSDNQFTHALMMVLLEHFIGDIHQPLHTFSHTFDDCHHDEGGNLFCLQPGKQKCKFNLHKLWDNGLGLFTRIDNIHAYARNLQYHYPAAHMTKELHYTSPKQWAEIEGEYAPLVYGTIENQWPNNDYFQNGQKLAERQVVLAGYRLALALNNLL